MGNTHSQRQTKAKINFSRSSKHATLATITETQEEKYSNTVLTALPPSPTPTKDKTVSETIIISGRKYQNINKKYVLPADDQEQDRLVQCHFIYKYLYGTNFCAPVRDLLSVSYQDKKKRRNSTASDMEAPRVLDIACGNGTWILEMATEFPETLFYGIDFYPNYPTTIKPTNTFFSQHDILNPKGLPYPDNYFDYVFMRQVYSCFSESDWTIVVKEIKRVVKQGGYVEFRDVDPILKNMGPKTYDLLKKYPYNMKKIQGVDINWARCMHDYLSIVGDITDMHQRNNALRFGAEDGPIDSMINSALRSGLESYRLFFEKNNHLPTEVYTNIIDQVVDESCKHNSYFNYYCCWGRKPLLDYESSSSSSRRHSNSHHSIGGGSSLYDDDDNTSIVAETIMGSRDNNEEEVKSLGAENVYDIDQFVEGFED